MVSILEKYTAFVNDQTEFQSHQAKRFSSNAYRRDLHLATATNLRGLFEDAQRLETENEQLQAKVKQLEEVAKLLPHVDGLPSVAQLALKPEEIEGLPKEVLEELSVSGADALDFKILAVINDSGGMSTLDRIIIGLFKNYNETIKRSNLTARLNRMIPKGLLHSVPGRKGLYSTSPISNESIP